MSSLLVLIGVYRLEIHSVMLAFSTSFVNYCLSNLLSGSPPPPLPLFPKAKYSIYRQCVQCVAGRGWGGVKLCCRPYSARFNTLFLNRFRTYKIVFPSQTKTYEGRRPQTDKHLPQSPFKCQFGIVICLMFLRLEK
jgi:hypothetical protein